MMSFRCIEHKNNFPTKGLLLDWLPQNGYIERFNRSYQEGVLDAFVMPTIHEAREETLQWMEDYNKNHPRESLGDKTPAECR